MLSPRWRPVVFFLIAACAIWGVAIGGYFFAQNSRMTAQKLAAYAQSIDLGRLTGAERAKALKRLADKINALSLEERRKARLDQAAWGLFEKMTDQEKEDFVDATMPTGFKQMLTAFEQLPEDKRRRSIDDALRRLREAQARLASGSGEFGDSQTNGTTVLTPELQAKIRTIGLKAFYSQSSAQTKAELAPVLEELQRVMESGRPFRGR